MSDPVPFRWPDYPPITQGDGRSDRYWELIKRQELEQVTRRASEPGPTAPNQPPQPIEFHVEAEVLPRICLAPGCHNPLPDSRPDRKYCSISCKVSASKFAAMEGEKERQAAAAAAAAVTEESLGISREQMVARYGEAAMSFYK